MSQGTPISRIKALEIAEKEILSLEGKVRRIMICGSIRREKDVVHDIDLVMIKDDSWVTDRKAFSKQVEVKGVPGPVQIDWYLTSEESWGASILMWTGSMELNVKMRARAKALGYKLNQYGLYVAETNERIAGATEEEIFEALGLKYLHPTKRSIDRYTKLEVL